MKKLVLLISVIIPLLFSFVEVDSANNDLIAISNDYTNCNVNTIKLLKDDIFIGNGFVYKSDNNYSYIVTSSKIIKDKNYDIIIDDKVITSEVIGVENNNQVAVLKTIKIDNMINLCVADSNYLYKGAQNIIRGYFNRNEDFIIKTIINKIGDVAHSNNYINVYKNIINLNADDIYEGSAIYDDYNRLTGMVTGFNEKLVGSSYMIESNKLVKIVESIIKTGKYDINYIKYSLVDYGSLSKSLKDSYNVSDKVKKGVVITTFRPLRFVFGGLNQGMIITHVNGVEINNTYELDRQLSRYSKNSKVCLTVVKKNGKIANYYEKV